LLLSANAGEAGDLTREA